MVDYDSNGGSQEEEKMKNGAQKQKVPQHKRAEV
jgi:hypothetical protein